MNKKVALSVLSATVFASMAASAFAAPKSGLYIGGNVDKYYSMNTLLGGMSSSALDQFSTEIGSAGFGNLIYVDFDGKGASIAEIMSATDFDSAKKDLTADKFEGVYSNIKADGSADGTYDPRNDAIDTPTGDLKVESVSAINLKQLKVVFNQAVDKTSAEDEDFYLENGTAIGTDATAEVQEDGKTVILTFVSPKAANTSFSYKVDGVLAKDGTTPLESDSFTATYADTVKPTITKSEYKGTKVVVTFSEPLKTAPTTFRVNGQPYTASFVAGSKQQVEATVALTAGTTATIYAAGAVDEADNVMDLYNGTVVVPAADVTKPAVVSITQIAQDKVRVKFSEKLNDELATGDVKILKGATVFSHVGTGTDASITVAKNTDDTTETTYDVTINLDGTTAGDGIYATGAASQVLTFLIDKDLVDDAAGNKNDAVTQTVTLTRDASAPTLTSSKVTTDKYAFELAFNESLVAVDLTGIIVTDANGVRFPVDATDTKIKVADDKVLVVDLISGNTAMANGTYTIKVPAGALKDAQGNATAEVTATLTVGTASDTTKPVATISTAANNKFKVAFKNGSAGALEEVTSSALSLANYKLDGNALPTGTDIYFTDANKNTVEIVLPANSVNIGPVGAGATAVLSVSGVADKAGNVMAATSGDVTVEDNTPATLTTAQLLADTLVLTFSENLDDTTAPANIAALLADFDIKAGSTLFVEDGATTDATATTSISGNKLTINIAGGDSNWATVKAGALTVTTDGALVKDANGVKVKDAVTVTVAK